MIYNIIMYCIIDCILILVVTGCSWDFCLNILATALLVNRIVCACIAPFVHVYSKINMNIHAQ